MIYTSSLNETSCIHLIVLCALKIARDKLACNIWAETCSQRNFNDIWIQLIRPLGWKERWHSQREQVCSTNLQKFLWTSRCFFSSSTSTAWRSCQGSRTCPCASGEGCCPRCCLPLPPLCCGAAQLHHLKQKAQIYNKYNRTYNMKL